MEERIEKKKKARHGPKRILKLFTETMMKHSERKTLHNITN